MVLTPQELASLRAALRALFAETVTVRRRERVADGAGGWTVNEAVVGTVPVRFAGLSTQLQELARSLQVTATGSVVCPWDADVAQGDVLERADGTRWRVVALVPAATEYLVRRVLVERE